MIQNSNDRWDLPWPPLEIPPYRSVQVKQWYIKTALLLIRKGYFRVAPAQGPESYTMLVRESDDEPTTVMSTLPTELESNAPHVAAALGNTVIMGAGIGLTLYNILKTPKTSNVIVVERDPSVIQLLHEATGIENWPGFGKLTIVEMDAFQFVTEEHVDFLYVDIWDELGEPDALAQTQQIQSNVRADWVGWWGQEIAFARWLNRTGLKLPPTLDQYRQWANEVDLPLIERDNLDYMNLIQTVTENFPELVDTKTSVGGQEFPQVQPKTTAPETPEGLVARTQAPDGTELFLCERNGEFGIFVDGRALMSSETCASEQQLARLSCEPLRGLGSPHVVVGGLGMGYTVRAALNYLPDMATVTVVEVLPAMVEWNRGPLGPLTNHALKDERVRVEVADIRFWVESVSGSFDALLLDVDNGPAELTLESNRAIYSIEGLARIKSKLNKGGVLGIWSATRVRELERGLDTAGYLQTKIHRVPSRGAKGDLDHVVYISRT